VTPDFEALDVLLLDLPIKRICLKHLFCSIIKKSYGTVTYKLYLVDNPGSGSFCQGQRDDSGTAIAYTGAVFAGSRMQILLVFSQN
jgi:hypothetical protein